MREARRQSEATVLAPHPHPRGRNFDLGTSKGDGTAPILKGCGRRWGRSIVAWFVPMSRDRQPKMHVINRTTAALTEAGFRVETDVGRTSRRSIFMGIRGLRRIQQRPN